METLSKCLYKHPIHEETEPVDIDFFPLKSAARVYFNRDTGGLKVLNLKHIALDNSDNAKRLEFTSENVDWNNGSSIARTSHASTTQRNTSLRLRKKERTNYAELVDKVILYGVDCHHNLVVICKVEDETLHTAIFDESAQFKKVVSLPPVRLSRPSKWTRVDCSEIKVRLTTTCLYVLLTLYDDAKSTRQKFLYSINLLGENHET